MMSHLTIFYLRFIYTPFKRSIHWIYLSLASVRRHALQKSFWEAGIAGNPIRLIWHIHNLRNTCLLHHKSSNCSCRNLYPAWSTVLSAKDRIFKHVLNICCCKCLTCFFFYLNRTWKECFQSHDEDLFSQIIHYWEMFHV